MGKLRKFLARVFPFAEPLESLEKEGKRHKKRKEKSKEIEKSKDWRVRAFSRISLAWKKKLEK